MKSILPVLFGIMLMLALVPCTSHAGKQDNSTTFIIPVKGPIERGLLYTVRRGMAEANAKDASAVIFHMDTPGGSVAVTEKLIRMMIDLPRNIQTYTFVDKDALSAGALISLSTENIYMSPGSRIGASAIVTATGDIPEGDMKEKYVSATLALVRSAAVRNGHDPDIAAAMMRKEYEYKIGEDVICPAGKLLTLTSHEATSIVKRNGSNETLLATGIVEDLPGLLKEIGREDSKVVRLEATWAENLARRIEMLGALFLIGGLLGIYVEIKTPGLGLPGLLGIICLAIFFWGHNVAGLAGLEEILFFVLGLLLLVLEIFVIPGFGIAGISGLVLMTASLLFSMVEHYPGNSWLNIPPDQIQSAIVSVGSALAGSVILMAILARYIPKAHMFSSVFLQSSVSKKEGYTSSEDTPELIGAKGFAVTQLRPAGIGSFGDKRLNVVARGAFIEKGQPIVIAETYGNRIVVDEIRQS